MLKAIKSSGICVCLRRLDKGKERERSVFLRPNEADPLTCITRRQMEMAAEINCRIHEVHGCEFQSDAAIRRENRIKR